MSELPLAAASIRLRGRPGRPRKGTEQDTGGATPARLEVRRATEGVSGRAQLQNDVPVNVPRLLDVAAAAEYLSVSVWTIRDLEAAGELQRVRLPLPGHREVRRLLFDRLDLDRLVERSKG